MIGSVDELEASMLRAKPGKTVEYWRGRLASDREYMGTYPWLDALVRRIMELAMSGELIASQRRLNGPDFSYRVTMPSPRKAA